MDVSIIIVNYNTKDLLFDCLKSIYEHTKDIQFEVIVSDNGSTDGSIDMLKKKFPTVILIENKENLGFGAANNRGLIIARGKYIFLLNSDTKLLNNAVKFFLDFYINNPNLKLGGIGCNLRGEDNTLIHSYGFFPNYINHILFLIKINIVNFLKFLFIIINYDYRKIKKNKSTKKYIGEVEYITGADLFFKNDNIHFFDEIFFLYFEETDMEFELSKKGYNFFLVDGPEIVHYCGGSSDKIGFFQEFTTISNIQEKISRIKFFKKNKKNFFGLFLLKLFTIFIWLNPFIYNKVKKYIPELIKL